FALMGTPFYFKDENIPNVGPYLPNHLLPHDVEIIRQMYERAPDGRVPWQFWWQPGLLWMGFFLALWVTMYCLIALFYRAWAEDERLSFPLVSLPMEVTGGDTGQNAFFRNRLMWAGFALAAVYNLFNIWHALNPSVPEFGKNWDFATG